MRQAKRVTVGVVFDDGSKARREERGANVPTELGPDGKPSAWAHVWAACQSRTLRDRHADQSAEQGIPAVTLTISDGVAVAVVTSDGDDLTATLAPWDLEKTLGID